jgi:hypothetical protein
MVLVFCISAASQHSYSGRLARCHPWTSSPNTKGYHFYTFFACVAFFFRIRMDSPMQDDNYGGVIPTASSETFQLRGYQAEMVAESMKDNVIVVMDTGSGKTHM